LFAEFCKILISGKRKSDQDEEVIAERLRAEKTKLLSYADNLQYLARIGKDRAMQRGEP
jgi:hypothetical protein